MGPRGDHPAALVTHVDDPIADDPVDRELGALETLAGERLHRIAPELGDAHHRLPDVETRRHRGGIREGDELDRLVLGEDAELAASLVLPASPAPCPDF